MLHTIKKQMNVLKTLLNDYNVANNTLSVIRALSNSHSIPTPLSVSPKSITSNQYKLITAYSGISKDHYLNQNNPMAKSRKFIVGDDSW
jgi:hypothetical protein